MRVEALFVAELDAVPAHPAFERREGFEAAAPTVGPDGQTLIWRQSGRYFYALKKYKEPGTDASTPFRELRRSGGSA